MSISTRRGAIALLAGIALSAFAVAAAEAQVTVNIVERAPPAAIVETIPVAPGAGYNWVPGHYAWRWNHWAWIRGHYIRGFVAPMPAIIAETPPPPPGPRWFWVRGHYVWERGGWAWRPGHWVR